MAEKKEPIAPETENIAQATEAAALLAAKNEALADELAALKSQLADEKLARETLETQVASLGNNLQSVASSVKFGKIGEEELAAPPEKPTVKIGGKSLKFRFGRFIFEAETLLAAEVAKDKKLLEQLAKEAPGLFEEV